MPQNTSLDDLSFNFFRVFSRTEYALKASGYHEGDGDAYANWRKFAEDVDHMIANPSSPKLKEAIEFIFNAPPKKQVIVSGIIQWKVATPSTDLRADELFIYIRRVRNNLFHGGKFNGRWFEPERSENLLRYSLIVLESCVDCVPAIKAAYRGS